MPKPSLKAIPATTPTQPASPNAASTKSLLQPTLPDVFDQSGWAKLAPGYERFDLSHLVLRLDEFKASGASARTPAVDAGDWRASIVAALRDRLQDAIDQMLLNAKAGEDEAELASKVATEAITHHDSPYHDRLRGGFHDAVHDILEEARSLVRAYGKIRTAALEVPLARLAEPQVESHAEGVERRLDIARAIEAEPHKGRKAALRMTYEGSTKAEIAEHLVVSQECVRVWLRACRTSHHLAPYAREFVDRRRL